MMRALIYISLVLSLAISGCGQRSNTGAVAENKVVAEPQFNTDSAMLFLKAQTDFGPRVPGTRAHSDCGDYLVSTLRRLGADTVMEQRVDVEAWNGDILPLRNIVARFNSRPGVKPVLLLAHWDSRPWADAEKNEADVSKPIDGANDGASGIAVLLEIARQASLNGTLMPVDILFVDGEDYGSHEPDDNGDSWCLGTQAWLESRPYEGEASPRYAILLDMVGGRDARFHKEYISSRLAPGIVDMVWNTAARLGMSDRFVNEPGGAVTDDHLFLNRAGIQAIDIIENKNDATGSFNPTWHTLDDNFENIDKVTLGYVGRLVSYLTIKDNAIL